MSSLYASTPHLFVYQPSCGEEDVDTDPSDCGYSEGADSTRSAGGGSASGFGGSGYAGSGRGLSPEPIYYSPHDLAPGNGNMEPIDPLSASTDLTDMELMRVETFFRGHQTQIFVCPSLANLYVRSAKSLVGLNRFSSQPDVCIRTLQKQEHLVSSWQLKFTGVPVVLLDLGGTKSRDQRRISLILAERDTGFALWRDTIDNLSNYESPQATFHTLVIFFSKSSPLKSLRILFQ